MSATSSSTGFFGFDLQQSTAAARLKTAFDGLAARLTPAVPVRLLHPDGTQSTWVGARRMPDQTHGAPSGFTAVEAPDDLLLRRTLLLPRLSPGHTQEAIALEVRTSSPFALQDLSWGSGVRSAGAGQGQRTQIDVVIASRRQIDDFIKARWPDVGANGQPPEVWALGDLPAPVILGGFGEARRLGDAARRQRRNWALLGMAISLAVLAALTPTMQLHARAGEAALAYDTLAARSVPLVRKRDELFSLNDTLRTLDAAVADQVDPVAVMQALTQALPDDSHLYSLDLQKTKVTASGHTVDASALLQKLNAEPRFRDVRSPAAVTRMPGAVKEVFTVEFTLTPPAPVVSPPSVAAASAPAPMPATASTAPAAPSVPAAVAPVPAGKPGASPFVIGGSK